MYHKGPGVKKSGPKGRNKANGKVLDAILEESDNDPSAPSHVISGRVRKRTGVDISPRTVRRVRNERGKSGSMMRTSTGASAPRSPRMSS
jgi:hypothetical protein